MKNISKQSKKYLYQHNIIMLRIILIFKFLYKINLCLANAQYMRSLGYRLLKKNYCVQFMPDQFIIFVMFSTFIYLCKFIIKLMKCIGDETKTKIEKVQNIIFKLFCFIIFINIYMTRNYQKVLCTKIFNLFFSFFFSLFLY